ncbi:unnamed protein product [Arabidopsis halleri]
MGSSPPAAVSPADRSDPVSPKSAWVSPLPEASVPRLKPVVNLVDGVARVSVPVEIVEESSPLWKCFVVGYFMGDAPHLGTIHATVNRIWNSVGKASRIDVQFLSPKTVLFRIENEQTRARVLRRKYWHIADVPLVLNEWSPETVHEKPSLTAMPLWVDFRGVPGFLFSQKGLRFLADITGEFVRLNPNTERCTRLDMARILVEVNLEKVLTETICVEDSEGSEFTVSVSYPWLPPRCNQCLQWGHKKADCSKKNTGVALVNDLENVSAIVEEGRHVGSELLAVNNGSTVVCDGVGVKSGCETNKSRSVLVVTENVAETSGEQEKTEQGWSIVPHGRKSSPLRKPADRTDLPLGLASGFRVLEDNPKDGEIVETETEQSKLVEDKSSGESENAAANAKSGTKRNGKQKHKQRPILNKKDMLQMRPQSQKFTVGCLLETRIQEENYRSIFESTFPGWQCLNNYMYGRLGRIWVCWSAEVDLHLIHMSAQQITCWIRFQASGEIFICSFVYASNFAIDRRALWKELTDIQVGCVQTINPWIVVGDFNVTLATTEHSRYLDYLQDQSAMQEFQNMLQNCGLEDLSYVGPVFTWSNSQDGNSISKKLDRALVNGNWLGTFSSAYATFEMGGVSDHARLWIWSSTQPLFHSRSALTLLHKKLKSLKEHLRRLNRERYGDLPSRVKAAYEELCAKQNAALQNPREQTYEAVTEASERWNHLASIEEQFFHQKSRVQWMQFGDQNTSYFHKTAESRAARNAIKHLTTSNGEVLTELSDIKAEAVRHYKSFLQDQQVDIEVPSVNFISQLVSFRCTSEDAARLVQPSLHGTLAVFTDFAHMSGLNINISKSSIFAEGRGKLSLEQAAVNSGLEVCEWLPIGRLVDILGTAGSYQLGVPKFAKVSEVINDAGWSFRRCRNRNVMEVIRGIRGLKVPSSAAGDLLSTEPDPDWADTLQRLISYPYARSENLTDSEILRLDDRVCRVIEGRPNRNASVIEENKFTGIFNRTRSNTETIRSGIPNSGARAIVLAKETAARKESGEDAGTKETEKVRLGDDQDWLGPDA